jgi:hypothetical protein
MTHRLREPGLIPTALPGGAGQGPRRHPDLRLT